LALSSANGSNSLHVLVVEDEVLVRAQITQYLRDCGCTVFEANTAEQAIAMCRAGVAVDVLVTDINLNGPSSGWDVAEAFRAARPAVAVVYASGNSVDRCRCVPGSLFFSKPYRLSDILEACQHLPKNATSVRS
jgi:CheY-like chemotaxis protein